MRKELYFHIHLPGKKVLSSLLLQLHRPLRKVNHRKAHTLNKINQETEKSTLGDLEALSALKDKMESAAKPAAAKPAKKAAA